MHRMTRETKGCSIHAYTLQSQAGRQSALPKRKKRDRVREREEGTQEANDDRGR